jgi:hypothetical protein
MKRIAFNYVALLLAMLLPILALTVVRTPDWLVSAMLFASLAIVVFVGLTVERTGLGEEYERHERIQVLILLGLGLGGLLTAARFFLLYEQFRLQIDVERPILYLVFALWIAVMLGIVYGLWAMRPPARKTPKPSKTAGVAVVADAAEKPDKTQ